MINEDEYVLREALEISDILRWIVENTDDTEAMDKINRITYQFSSKYKGGAK